MRVQYVSKYLALAEDGLVQKMYCPMDQGILFCNVDVNESIVLYCLSCDYTKIVGISLYADMVKKVDEIINGQTKN